MVCIADTGRRWWVGDTGDVMAHMPACRFIDESGNLLLAVGGFYSSPRADEFVTIDGVKYKVESTDIDIQTKVVEDVNGNQVATSISRTVLNVTLVAV